MSDRRHCSKPIDAAVFADYWLGLLASPEEEAVEEHLFACDLCGDRVREIIALAEGIRQLARDGSLCVSGNTRRRRAVACNVP